MVKILFRPSSTTKVRRPPRYLAFTAMEDGVSIGYKYAADEIDPVDIHLKIEYSLDGGTTWDLYTVARRNEDVKSINLNSRETVLFRGNNQNLAYYQEKESQWQFTTFVIKGLVAASGDVTSLLNKFGYEARLESDCFHSLFKDCTRLVSAPSLPSENIAPHCYSDMFYGCTLLAEAPALPATSLQQGCYHNMFYGCTSLAEAPALPATTLESYCYHSMFQGCTSLAEAPVLPATTLASYCYRAMFQGCTSLAKAPALPATTLASYCYRAMFQGCTSLAEAPALPATTLESYCYHSMFYGCTSLAEAPVLPATTLASYCYHSMFYGCSSLNYIKALFTTEPNDYYTNNWVAGVASKGVFVKSNDASWNVLGVNGVPQDWVIEVQSV